MRTISPTLQAALAARRLRARDYLWIIAKDLITDAPVSVGFWSGLENSTHQVVDPHTGSTVSRAFYGAGSLIAIDDIPAIIGFDTSPITISMSQLDTQVNNAVRGYNCKFAEVQTFRGAFDPDTNVLLEAAFCRFFGYIDNIKIVTPKENEDGNVILTCMPGTVQALRSNPSIRSHEDQGGVAGRHPGDDFFKDAAVVGDWGPMQWGPETVDPNAKKKGLLGWGGGFLGL